LLLDLKREKNQVNKLLLLDLKTERKTGKQVVAVGFEERKTR